MIAVSKRHEIFGRTFLEVYARHQQLVGFAGIRMRGDDRLAASAAALCDRYQISYDQHIAYWRARMNDFVPVIFPPLKLVASQSAVVESSTLRHREIQDHVDKQLIDDATVRAALSGAGCAESEWGDRSYRLLHLSALERLAGHDVFVPHALEPAVSAVLELYKGKTAPKQP